MSRVKRASFTVKDIEPWEHLDYTLKNMTPSQRFEWLGQAWDFWYQIRKRLPKKLVELQDKFRRGEI